MAIGTPTLILVDTNIVSGGSGITTVDAPAGSLIVLFIYNNSNGSAVTGVTLSSGDTVTRGPNQTSANGSVEIWYVSNTAHDLPVASTISVTVSTGNLRVAAYVVSGANGGLDKTNAGTATSTGPSLATGTLGASSEIVFGGLQTVGYSGFTQATGFTALIADGTRGAAYDIVSSTASVTYNPRFASTTYSAVVATFKATATGETGTANLAFGGIGLAVAGRAQPIGTANLAFSGVSYTAAGTLSVPGTATLTFAGVGLSVAGRAEPIGTIGLAFSGVSYAATGVLSAIATATLSFGGIGLAAVGRVEPIGTAILAFAGAAFSAIGSAIASATANLAFAGIGITATGTSGSSIGNGGDFIWLNRRRR
jgi:hypothetical protein